MSATSDATPSLRFRVAGMDCPSCALKIETALKAVPGVGAVAVNVSAGKLSVVPSSPEVSAVIVTNVLRGLGYSATIDGDGSQSLRARVAPHDHDDHGWHGSDDAPWWRTPKAAIAMASALLLVAAYAVTAIFPLLEPWPFVVATILSVMVPARRAIAAIRAGVVFSIELLMTVAALGALAIGAVEEALVVLVLFAVGELLEGVAAGSARRSIGALSRLAPSRALLVDGSSTRDVAADALQPGMIVLVRPGDRIPCDGRIAEGETEVDESPVTGESVPSPKRRGDEVFAGSINLVAVLQIEVTRASNDNIIARIVRLVEAAQEARAPVHRFIDRFAQIYMPVVVAVATIVALAPPIVAGESWGVWIYRALALLLIACPCALVISTPAAIAAGLAVGARRGLLVKGGAALETLASIRLVAFDKTGTLTAGCTILTDAEGVSAAADEAVRIAAALERGSNHPIARAVIAYAESRQLRLTPAYNISVVPGKGVTGVVEGRRTFVGALRDAPTSAFPSKATEVAIEQLERQGKTVALVTQDNDLLGFLALRDEPRPDARSGIAALATLGVSATILSGDNMRTATALAQELGVTAHAELMPGDKVSLVRRFQQAGAGPVALVGDGINDAPALAAADIGIAMGSGTDVALETADAALLNNRVGSVAELISLARATIANVRVNVAIALGSKIVFLVTTIIGLTGMWIAVLADTGATVVVTLNALSLLGHRFARID